MSHSDVVKEHFEIKYTEYDTLIRKLIPKYEEMHQQAIDLIDLPKSNATILDLGIGTGQTAEALFKKFPAAEITGLDISPKMLEQTRERLAQHKDHLHLSEGDMKSIQLQNEYDACIAILSIHHLNGEEKTELFKQIHKHLTEEGIFVIGDLIKFSTEAETEAKEKEWKAFLIQGLGVEKGEYWYRNYEEEDLPSTVNEQLAWLQKAGFSKVGCTWQHINYAVFYGKK